MDQLHDLSPTPHPIPVIGLLGAPGSGKSAVAQVLSDLGCAVIDADRLAREALGEDEVKAALRSWWGPDVIGPSGEVDRASVSRIVFDQPAELKRLESLTHPIVNRQRQEKRLAFFTRPDVHAVVEDCPLLLEAGLDHGCDVLIFVDAGLAVRQKRVRQTRGWSASELARRESRQWPLDMKRHSADYVVRNGAGHEELRQQVSSVLSQIRQRFKAGIADQAESKVTRGE
ncbi:MAG: dephospho-CoA kinase [Planctomycetota bacterium]